MTTDTNVLIVGAGPYGLSLAAYLRGAGVDFRIFGKAMGAWREKMPAGMMLKSDGFASNLYEPQGAFTLRSFCEQRGIRYQDTALPVALDTFVSYALEFQRKFVPDLDAREVIRVEPLATGGFVVRLSTGEQVSARKVVVATGISHFQHIPSALAALPREHLSHSSESGDLGRYAGRDVIVVGAGASALDMAALVHRAGGRVQLVARRAAIPFILPPRNHRPLMHRMRHPVTGLGPGWKNVFCAKLPRLFYLLPEGVRHDMVRRHLGPAPAWFTREQTEGRFPFVLSATPVHATAANGRVRLGLAMADGTSRTLEADHIIAGTGYKVDLRRLPFLDEQLLAMIETEDQAPRLSQDFESSVAGLYFIGLAAANCFGPLLRFAYGAGFAVPRVARHLVAAEGVSPPPRQAQAWRRGAGRPIQ